MSPAASASKMTAEPSPSRRARPRAPCAQPVFHQRHQNVLLGERFGAEHIAATAARKIGDEGQQQDQRQSDAPGHHAIAVPQRVAALDQGQQLVDR